MKQHLRIAILMTLVTTVLFGLLYPLAVTGLAQFFLPTQANGALIVKNGLIVGSHLIGQPFSSAGYFILGPPQPATAMTRPPLAVQISAPRIINCWTASNLTLRNCTQKIQPQSFPWILSLPQAPAWILTSLLQPPNFRLHASRASVA